MDSIRGLPLLSGPPPHLGDSEYCRKCNKEFNRIFNRAKRCNHCGYQFCSSCCEHTALMPRIGVYNGFDPVDVCSYCIEVLRVTAMGRSQLRAMPLSHLKAYMSAYGLAAPNHAVEKDDFVRAVIEARETNGCLPKANEEYYRRHSIPEPSGERPRSFLARMADGFADLADLLPQPDLGGQQPPPVPPRPNTSRPPQNAGGRRPPAHPPRPQFRPETVPTNPVSGPPRTPQGHFNQPPPRPTNSRPQPQPQSQPHASFQSRSQGQARGPPSPSPPQRPIPQPVPMEQLLGMGSEDISKLSIGILKATLNHNHVRIPQDALEKRDLVEKVVSLVGAARAEGERDARARAAEEQVEMEAQRAAFEEIEARKNKAREVNDSSDHEDQPQDEEQERHGELPKAARPAAAKLERDGLCVICQDEDANIAIVDCGHLCLCMECSELVMSSSKECPLCRTRIVTSQRLLRIFRT